MKLLVGSIQRILLFTNKFLINLPMFSWLIILILRNLTVKDLESIHCQEDISMILVYASCEFQS
jgi:hypothetical protein